MRFYIGTSGFSYKEWKGPFYPKDLQHKDMLRYYGANLPAVEINNTFYRMPRESSLQVWTEQVPSDFRFVLKAPRKITHTRPLKEKSEDVGYFLKMAAALGDKLGVILFQLPPYLHRDIELLSDFLTLLPSGTRAAFEFRHRSWFDDALYEALHRKGCALCCADSADEDLGRFVATADWGYLRLRKPSYPEAELLGWAQKLKSQNWKAVYAFFKHEEEGAGPALAKRFLARLQSSGSKRVTR